LLIGEKSENIARNHSNNQSEVQNKSAVIF